MQNGAGQQQGAIAFPHDKPGRPIGGDIDPHRGVGRVVPRLSLQTQADSGVVGVQPQRIGHGRAQSR